MSGSKNEYERRLQRIEKILKKIAPGALVLLDTAARRCCNKSYAELLAELRLPAIKALLRNIYGDSVSLDAAICIFVARPLIEALGLRTEPRELARLVLEDKWQEAYRLLGVVKEETIQEKPETFTELLLCAYAIELVAVKAYSLLASIINDPIISEIAEYISEESKQHANVVKVLARELGLRVPDTIEEAVASCNDIHVKEYLRLVKELEDNIEKIRDKPELIAKYFRELAGLEKSAGEERYSRAIMPLIALLFTGKRGKLVRKLINLIASDEKHHEELAKAIGDYLGNADKEEND